MYLNAIEKCKEQGGKFVVEGGVLKGKGYESGCYVMPCIAEVKNEFSIVQHETFAPILYLMKYTTLDEAIALQNNVPQGLSSSIFTNNMRESEQFLSAAGSDCGIATLELREQRSVALLAGKKKPVVAAKAAAMPGKIICAGKQIP
jgi:aldehyde dehydrogenase (NAD+)